MINKKGMTRKLVDIVLVLAVTVLLTILVIKLLPFFSDETNKNQCATSLLAMQSTKIHIGTDLRGSGMRPHCTKETLWINKLQKGMEELSVEKQIADAMYGCFKKTGNGELDPFASKVFDARYYCILCSEVQFGKDAKKSVPEIYNLENFLKTHKQNQGIDSYWDTFLTGKFNFPDSYFVKDDFIINTSLKYDIVLVFDKMSKVASSPTQQIMRLIPEEQISKLNCDELYQNYE